MKRRDLLLISGLLAVAFCGYVLLHCFQKDGTLVRISVNGRQTAQMKLSHDQTYRIPLSSGTNVVKIKNRTVRMLKADCPDLICKHHSPISKKGETIVCLPHKVVVEIVEE